MGAEETILVIFRPDHSADDTQGNSPNTFLITIIWEQTLIIHQRDTAVVNEAIPQALIKDPGRPTLKDTADDVAITM